MTPTPTAKSDGLPLQPRTNPADSQTQALLAFRQAQAARVSMLALGMQQPQSLHEHARGVGGGGGPAYSERHFPTPPPHRTRPEDRLHQHQSPSPSIHRAVNGSPMSSLPAGYGFNGLLNVNGMNGFNGATFGQPNHYQPQHKHQYPQQQQQYQSPSQSYTMFNDFAANQMALAAAFEAAAASQGQGQSQSQRAGSRPKKRKKADDNSNAMLSLAQLYQSQGQQSSPQQSMLNPASMTLNVYDAAFAMPGSHMKAGQKIRPPKSRTKKASSVSATDGGGGAMPTQAKVVSQHPPQSMLTSPFTHTQQTPKSMPSLASLSFDPALLSASKQQPLKQPTPMIDAQTSLPPTASPLSLQLLPSQLPPPQPPPELAVVPLGPPPGSVTMIPELAVVPLGPPAPSSKRAPTPPFEMFEPPPPFRPQPIDAVNPLLNKPSVKTLHRYIELELEIHWDNRVWLGSEIASTVTKPPRYDQGSWRDSLCAMVAKTGEKKYDRWQDMFSDWQRGMRDDLSEPELVI